MRQLQSLLAEHETAIAVSFDSLNHRVRCYAHIINVCSSHVVASITSTSNSYLPKLDPNQPYDDDDDDDDDDDGNDSDNGDDECPGDVNSSCELADCYDVHGDPKLKSWVAGIKRDPLKCARKLVRFLRSSDQRREGFRTFIQNGNVHGWFTMKDNDGKRVSVDVPQLQLLRDVKTRWDSVYMMLDRLRQLRPVCLSR